MFGSVVANTFDNLKNMNKEDYIKDNSFHFTKKLSFKNMIGILLNNNGRNMNVESYSFFRRIKGYCSFSVSKSAISQRRQNIKPDIFIDVNEKLISDAYNELNVVDTKDIFKYNGMRVLAVDTSVMSLYNYPNLLEKYGIKSRLGSEPILRARLSCFTDVKTNMIVSSKFSVKATNELKIAIKQIEELENTINLEKTIILGDRGYDSVELIINIIEHNSYFILRLKKNKFKKERENITGNDETIQINLNKSRLKKYVQRRTKRKNTIKKEESM